MFRREMVCRQRAGAQERLDAMATRRGDFRDKILANLRNISETSARKVVPPKPKETPDQRKARLERYRSLKQVWQSEQTSERLKTPAFKTGIAKTGPLSDKKTTTGGPSRRMLKFEANEGLIPPALVAKATPSVRGALTKRFGHRTPMHDAIGTAPTAAAFGDGASNVPVVPGSADKQDSNNVAQRIEKRTRTPQAATSNASGQTETSGSTVLPRMQSKTTPAKDTARSLAARSAYHVVHKGSKINSISDSVTKNKAEQSKTPSKPVVSRLVNERMDAHQPRTLRRKSVSSNSASTAKKVASASDENGGEQPKMGDEKQTLAGKSAGTSQRTPLKGARNTPTTALKRTPIAARTVNKNQATLGKPTGASQRTPLKATTRTTPTIASGRTPLAARTGNPKQTPSTKPTDTSQRTPLKARQSMPTTTSRKTPLTSRITPATTRQRAGITPTRLASSTVAASSINRGTTPSANPTRSRDTGSCRVTPSIAARRRISYGKSIVISDPSSKSKTTPSRGNRRSPGVRVDAESGLQSSASPQSSTRKDSTNRNQSCIDGLPITVKAVSVEPKRNPKRKSSGTTASFQPAVTPSISVQQQEPIIVPPTSVVKNKLETTVVSGRPVRKKIRSIAVKRLSSVTLSSKGHKTVRVGMTSTANKSVRLDGAMKIVATPAATLRPNARSLRKGERTNVKASEVTASRNIRVKNPLPPNPKDQISEPSETTLIPKLKEQPISKKPTTFSSKCQKARTNNVSAEERKAAEEEELTKKWSEFLEHVKEKQRQLQGAAKL